MTNFNIANILVHTFFNISIYVKVGKTVFISKLSLWRRSFGYEKEFFLYVAPFIDKIHDSIIT